MEMCRPELATELRKHALLAELNVCSTTKNLKRGKEIHGQAVKTGSDSCIHVANSVVSMYAKCGSMAEAREVFDSIKHPNVVSWNALILGYAENGAGLTALDLFARMKSEGCAPNSITYIAALKACTTLEGGLERGRQIHSTIKCRVDVYLQTTLIDMYAKCKSMSEARKVFDGMKHRTVVSWNALITGYAANGEGAIALDLFARLKSQGCVPNSITYIAVLKACASLAPEQRERSLQRGKEIHLQIGCHWNINVRNTLIDMYAKCGSMVDAREAFDNIKHPDVVSWNALILGYAVNGDGVTALDLFERMRSQGFEPTSITFVAALKACISLLEQDGSERKAECRERGKHIHSLTGSRSNIYVQNTLIDLYAKCGSMADAREVFDRIENPDIVSWNALILGYAENGEGVTALSLFAAMKSRGCVPDCINYVAALKASGSVGALECGRKIHGEIDPKTERNEILVTCLVDFYAKCGNLIEAQKVFDRHPETRNLITFNALLGGYSRVGDSIAVFRLYHGMHEAGLHPDGVTFLCILACCLHGGLVEDAHKFFEAMSRKHGMSPSIEHYTCMIDILGRANNVDEAISLLRCMPCKPNTVTWMALLGACSKWKKVWIGRLAFRSCICLDETNASAYVLMAHIFESRGMSEEQEMVLMRKRHKARKVPVHSFWMNGADEIHSFTSEACE